MAHAKMTLIGFYNYLDAVNVDLFAALDDMPAGIDKSTLEDNILLQGGEFEVLFADPYFLKQAIEPWVKKNYRTFDKWVKALAIEYDPLNNFDRYEEYTDTHTGTVENEGSGQDSYTDAGTASQTTTTNGTHEGDNTNETITQTSAYDAADFQNKDRAASTGHDESTDESTTQSTGQNGLTHSGNSSNNNTRTDDLQDWHQGHLYGNIGVTTSQQMLQAELDIAEWNLYEHITDLFINEFCIPVYI